jgi:tetratricopeptide (TPR) repeat protein/nitrate/TMAO reductase-like tetraheme cytochrome c subunit
MNRTGKITAVAFAVLVVNSLYLWSTAQASLLYIANILAHFVLGAGLVAVLLWLLLRSPEIRRRLRWSAPVLLASAVLGGFLLWKGAVTSNHGVVLAHLATGFLGAFLVAVALRSRQFWAVGTLATIVFASYAGYQRLHPWSDAKVLNPNVVPTSMQEEGAGEGSPFWPSSARTNTGKTIPAKFFMDSKRCAQCHKDIYDQWNSSMHHFASFNNQFYRKTIEHMQDISGTQGSKWCAGCHDHAMFFSGKFERPAREQIDTPEAQTGLGCISCHSIGEVHGSMGNGGFTLDYPEMHELATSDNPLIRWVHDFVTEKAPESHRRTFMKPFMRNSAEFCSACHKVHLDVPVNNYRWMRGFNDYDNWQASGVSGQGARSFYYPEKPLTCGGCHMQLVPSSDPAARNGMIHNHRFAAANTAVPTANQDETQLKAVEGFLKSGFISVDIFAATPAEEAPGVQMQRRAAADHPQQAMTSFAVGEEAETTQQFFLREVSKVAAPLDGGGTKFKPGSTARVDVVVRTKKIGHFFPGGTVDGFDVWLELEGRDATGKQIFWSGKVEDNGKGPVEKGAHFYKSFQLDGDGNPINKRNGWQMRSLLYVKLIPPGAADVAHYRVSIPKDAKGPITLTAKLNYRKFSWYYTHFAYAGVPKPNQDPQLTSVHYDSREYDFSPANIPANVSGKIKGRIPDLPIETLAKATATLELGDAKLTPDWKPVVRRQDRERWNDWGIGLLLQGDLKGAEYAFTRVTEADPNYADGWLNIARALIQEGETDAAKPYIEKALKLNPNLARIYFFRAMAEKTDGDYDAALASLGRAASMYPRDRVVQNQIGRLNFLKRDFAQAAVAFEKVLAIDPEDVQAHYNLMLCYRGLGDTAKAKREETLFRRFKADESAQAVTAKLRALSPEDNNERQQIHEHESVKLQ